MSLSRYQSRTKTMEYRGGSANFRGLTTNDIAKLIDTHRSDLDSVVGTVIDMQKQGGRTVERSLVLTILRDAPMLVANIMALASDEDDLAAAVEGARRMPTPLQTKALEIILELTFDEVGGLKPFISSLVSVMGRLLPVGVAMNVTHSSVQSSERSASGSEPLVNKLPATTDAFGNPVPSS